MFDFTVITINLFDAVVILPSDVLSEHILTDTNIFGITCLVAK